MEEFLLFVALMMVAVLYVVPSFIAFRRHHPKRWLLLLVNLISGFTVIGWVLCFVWAFSALQNLRPSVDGCFLDVRDTEGNDQPKA